MAIYGGDRSVGPEINVLRCINCLIDPHPGGLLGMIRISRRGPKPSSTDSPPDRYGLQQFNLVKRWKVMTNVLSGRLGYVNPWVSLLGLWSAAKKARHESHGAGGLPKRLTTVPMHFPEASNNA
jgi:ABC-type phosphate/phosphonate transport system ATPase subunit